MGPTKRFGLHLDAEEQDHGWDLRGCFGVARRQGRLQFLARESGKMDPRRGRMRVVVPAWGWHIQGWHQPGMIKEGGHGWVGDTSVTDS